MKTEPDNAFARHISGEVVTARWEDGQVLIGLNAKCGAGVVDACIEQANKVPALELSERQARGKVAGLSEVVMRQVIELENLHKYLSNEPGAQPVDWVNDVVRTLRAAVLVAT